MPTLSRRILGLIAIRIVDNETTCEPSVIL
jgi:hypothetical protein